MYRPGRIVCRGVQRLPADGDLPAFHGRQDGLARNRNQERECRTRRPKVARPAAGLAPSTPTFGRGIRQMKNMMVLVALAIIIGGCTPSLRPPECSSPTMEMIRNRLVRVHPGMSPEEVVTILGLSNCPVPGISINFNSATVFYDLDPQGAPCHYSLLLHYTQDSNRITRLRGAEIQTNRWNSEKTEPTPSGDRVNPPPEE